MGMLQDGQWVDRLWKTDKEGHFRRAPTTVREWIRRDGSTAFGPAANRYHLYVSYACPWAHRTLIVRALRKLDDVVSVSVVDHFMGDDGWTFSDNPGVVADSINGAKLLRDVYLAHDKSFTGRVTVPILWDRQQSQIVNNESREIIRMLDLEMAELGDSTVDLCPSDLADAIEATIDDIYEPINNGVYRSGFSQSQAAYDKAVGELFTKLDHYDGILSKQRYLCGDRMAEADVCLLTTLIRFDKVYHTHFKCNVRRIVDYPNLWGFVREIYQMPGVAETCNFEHITKHYYASHESVNPSRIVARGPDLDLNAPHGRDQI